MTVQWRGVTGKFFWGGKVIFPDFFFFAGVKCFSPVQNFHFGRPKTNFSRFEKWKAKKKKKKKKKTHNQPNKQTQNKTENKQTKKGL